MFRHNPIVALVVIFLASWGLNAQNPLQILLVQQQQPLCLSDSTGFIYVEIQGGALPYSIAWQQVGQTQVLGTGSALGQLASGLYQVQIVDAAADTLRQQFNLQALNDLKILGVVTAPSFLDEPTGTAVVTINGGLLPYSFNWNAGQASADGTSASQLPVGNHQLLVSDANGCETLYNFSVAAASGIALKLEKPILCGCDAQYKAIAPAAAVLPYTCTWANGQTGDKGLQLCTGLQQVQIIDAAGTLFTRSFTVEGVELFQTQIEIIAPGSFEAPSGAATILAQGGNPPYTYDWTGSETTTSQVLDIPSGVQFVVVSDAAQCDTLIEFIMPAGDRADCLAANSILTPNADGHNDLLQLSCIGVADVGTVELTIFDRAGRQIYHSTNYQNDWTGPNSTDVSATEAVYYWQAVASKNGVVTLKNNGHLTFLSR